MLQLTKKEVLYIGDSEVDIKTAQNAGLCSVFVSWGFREYEQVKDLRPDYVINRPEEIIELIEKE